MLGAGSAGFTCCVADFQVGRGVPRPPSLETRDTADLEVRATLHTCSATGRGRPVNPQAGRLRYEQNQNGSEFP